MRKNENHLYQVGHRFEYEDAQLDWELQQIEERRRANLILRMADYWGERKERKIFATKNGETR